MLLVLVLLVKAMSVDFITKEADGLGHLLKFIEKVSTETGKEISNKSDEETRMGCRKKL